MLKLQFKDHRQAPIWLADERFTIGQHAKNSLSLADSGISPFHAEIRQEQGHYYLSDCGSETGTFVNDERIGGRYQIRADDRLRLGPIEFELINPSKTPQRPEVTQKWFLQVIKGEHEGKKFPVTGSLTFGRSVKCELCFGDLELSRRHCEFFLVEDSLEVKDLGSANGVYVNREKITTAVLQAGDQLQMGAVLLLVIGPKVAVQQEREEDATVFRPALVLPSRPKTNSDDALAPAAKPTSPPAGAATPKQEQPARQGPAATRRPLLVVLGVGALAAVALVIWFIGA